MTKYIFIMHAQYKIWSISGLLDDDFLATLYLNLATQVLPFGNRWPTIPGNHAENK